MKVVITGKSAELVEKKSRFIAQVYSVKNVDEANIYIEETRKKYWDARHNCYAYVIGQRQEIKKFSDDGEPSGTAGKPILDVIEKGGITDCLVIVTRYFGGVLLGTGGLVRAYQGSTSMAIGESELGELTDCVVMDLQLDYGVYNRFEYMCKELDVDILEKEYVQYVNVKVGLLPGKESNFLTEVAKITGGKDVIKDRKFVTITKSYTGSS